MKKIKGDHLKNKEVKKKSIGAHLKHNEVKMSILEFILKNKEPVSEPSIREHLKNKHGVVDQSTINKHMHNLKDLRCIELISPKASRRNYWDVATLENLKDIRHEFYEFQINKYEKSINLILMELGCGKYSPYWLRYYIQLLISASFYNTCLEFSIGRIHQGITEIYNTGMGSDQHRRMLKLIKVCYSGYVKQNSGFKISQYELRNALIAFPWKNIFSFDNEYFLKLFEDYLPGLPKELPRIIFETKLSEIEGIPEEIPDEINAEDFVRYMLNTIIVIMRYFWNYNRSIDDLLLEHFFNHDRLIGVDSDDEHYYINKIKANQALPSGSIQPDNLLLRDKEFADLKLASEFIIKYKQPAKFNNVSDNLDEVYQAVVKCASDYQKNPIDYGELFCSLNSLRN
jgi:hypothetical protein